MLRKALRALELSGAANPREAVTLRMQILITLAKVESELRGVEAGLALLREATALLASGPDPQVVVALHNQRGVLLLRFGELRAAIEEFDKAERCFASATPLDHANVLLNRSSAALMLGNLTPARGDLERCAAVARARGLPLLQCMALHNLGYLEFLRGDLPRALQLMDEAIEQAVTFGIETNTVALLDRARVLVEAGLTREADAALAEGARIQLRDRSSQELAETQLERARCALIAGDVAAARRLAALARDRFRRRGNDAWRRTAELVLLQADLAAARPGSRLVQPALRIAAELRAAGLHATARTAMLTAAEAYLSQGLRAEAARLLTEVGPLRSRDPIVSRLHDRYVRARLDESCGRIGAAQRRVRVGLDDLAAYQAGFGGIDLQTASAVHGRKLGDLGLELALRQGRPSEVFDLAERARAVSTRLPVMQPPADEISAGLLAELRQVVENLRNSGADRSAGHQLVHRRRELEAAVAARTWRVAGTRRAANCAKVDDVVAVLDDLDSDMVIFIGAADELHALTLRDGRARLHRLGRLEALRERSRRLRADLDALALPGVPDIMAKAVRTTFERSILELDGALLRPLGAGGRRLVVVSTGVLGQLPWASMPSLRQVPVVVAPSATSWLMAAAQPAAGRDQIIALAGPDLPRAREEADAVAAVWAGHAVVGAAASRCALTAALGHASIAHVAAHGTHQTENPLFSFLRVADGPVFAHELDQSVRTPDHVVLSACDLGLATVRPGDEALGLTSVLLRLGTRSVVAGVARVGDDLAAETMIDYHRRLARGSDSAAALAESVAAAAGIAPFVCFGGTWNPVGGTRQAFGGNGNGQRLTAPPA